MSKMSDESPNFQSCMAMPAALQDDDGTMQPTRLKQSSEEQIEALYHHISLLSRLSHQQQNKIRELSQQNSEGAVR